MTDRSAAVVNGNVNLTADSAKAILRELLDAFDDPIISARLNEARDSAGSDMLKNMQFVFPVATEIQMDVIKNHGFTRDGKGATQFALAVKALEKDDCEVASLNAKVRSHFIPTMIPAQSTSTAREVQ